MIVNSLNQEVELIFHRTDAADFLLGCCVGAGGTVGNAVGRADNEGPTDGILDADGECERVGARVGANFSL